MLNPPFLTISMFSCCGPPLAGEGEISCFACLILAISALVALMVDSSMGRMLGVKQSLPGVGGGLEQLTGVNGDLELLEEKESTLFLDLPWREVSETWKVGVQGLDIVSWSGVVSCDLPWRLELETWRVGVQGLDTVSWSGVVLSASRLVLGVRGWLEADEPEVDRPKALFWPRCPSEKEPVLEAWK